MSALGQKQTCASQKAMSALHPIATAKADSRTRSCLLYPLPLVISGVFRIRASLIFMPLVEPVLGGSFTLITSVLHAVGTAFLRCKCLLLTQSGHVSFVSAYDGELGVRLPLPEHTRELLSFRDDLMRNRTSRFMRGTGCHPACQETAKHQALIAGRKACRRSAEVE